MSNRRRARPSLDHLDPVHDLTGVGRMHGEPGSLDGDVAFVRSVDGATYVLPTVIRRLDPDRAEIVAELQGHAAEISYLQAHLDEIVLAGRAAGLSWNVIGWSVGTTGEAARQRWGAAA